MDKITGPQVKLVIQRLRDQNSDIHFDNKEISHILVNTHITKDDSPVGQFDDTWKTHVDQEAVSYVAKEKEKLVSHTQQENYNVDIVAHEIDEAISRLNPHSAPGPDNILLIMLTQSGPILREALLATYQASWSQGNLPSIWKDENRIYLQKEGKEDYSNSKSYRSISLTSTVGKTFECVVDSRFIAWLEELGLLDSFQYAYRKGHNLTQALLYYSLQATKGLKTGHTVSCYIDFEGVFDNVWRNAILYKLHKAGLRGTLSIYIASFLSD